MAILRGEDARRYIAQNPNSGFKVISGGASYGIPSGTGFSYAPQSADRGLIGNILAAATKPFRMSFGGLADTLRAGSQVAPYLEQGMTFQDALKQADLESNFRPLFLDEAEFQKYSTEPVKTGAGTIAQLASFLTPASIGSGAIAGPARAGLVGGGVFGLGTGISEGQNVADVLSETAKGAALGGAIGAGTGAISKLLSGKIKARAEQTKAKKTSISKTVKGDAIGLNVDEMAKNKYITGRTEATRVRDSALDTLDRLNYSTRTATKASQSADDAIGTIRNATNKYLDDSGVTFSIDETDAFLNHMENKFRNEPQLLKSGVSGQSYDKYVRDLIELGDDYPASSLNAVREDIRNAINFARNPAAPQPRTEKVLSEMFDYVDDMLKNKQGLESARELLARSRDLHTAREFIQKKAAGGGKIKLSFPVETKIPMFGVDQGARTGAADVMDLLSGTKPLGGKSVTGAPEVAEALSTPMVDREIKILNPDTGQYDIVKTSVAPTVKATKMADMTSTRVADALQDEVEQIVNVPKGQETSSGLARLLQIEKQLPSNQKSVVSGFRKLYQEGLSKTQVSEASTLVKASEAAQKTAASTAKSTPTRGLISTLAQASYPISRAAAISAILGGGVSSQPSGQEYTGVPPTTGYPATSGVDQQRVTTFLGLLNSGYSPSESKTILDILGMGTGTSTFKMTESQKKFAAASQAAQQALALLESGVADTGKVETVSGWVERLLGTQPAGQTDYRSRIAMARTLARGAMLGSAMSEQELASLEASIPEYSDEPEIARQKLLSFIDMMNAYSTLGGGATETPDYSSYMGSEY